MRTANAFAMISENVRSDVIDATQFPDMARQYQVFAVPKVVINDKTSFEGNLPPHQFVGHIEQVAATNGEDQR